MTLFPGQPSITSDLRLQSLQCVAQPALPELSRPQPPFPDSGPHPCRTVHVTLGPRSTPTPVPSQSSSLPLEAPRMPSWATQPQCCPVATPPLRVCGMSLSSPVSSSLSVSPRERGSGGAHTPTPRALLHLLFILLILTTTLESEYGDPHCTKCILSVTTLNTVIHDDER